jgi:hypothetical protein
MHLKKTKAKSQKQGLKCYESLFSVKTTASGKDRLVDFLLFGSRITFQKLNKT